MDLELNSASPPLRVSSLLSGPLRDGHTRRSVGGPRTLLIEATPFSEVVRHDPCFDISRGRPVSLIVREGRGLKGSAREAGVGMETGYRRLRETSTVVVFTPRATAASASPSLSSSSRMRTAPDTTSGAEHPAQPSGPRSGGPGLPPHRFLHPEGDRARHITFHRQLGVVPHVGSAALTGCSVGRGSVRCSAR